MKYKFSQVTKKSVSLLLAILMMFSMLTIGIVTANAAIEGVSVLYFTDTEGTWDQAGASFKLKCTTSDDQEKTYYCSKIDNTGE